MGSSHSMSGNAGRKSGVSIHAPIAGDGEVNASEAAAGFIVSGSSSGLKQGTELDLTVAGTGEGWVTTIGAQGAWSADITGLSLLPDGTYDLLATAGTASAQMSFILDETAPTVGAISESPSSGTVTTGQSVVFSLQTSENVIVYGSPSMLLNDGGTASYVSGSGTNTLLFQYTVQQGQGTADLQPVSLNLGSGSITDQAGNPLVAGSLPASGSGVQVDGSGSSSQGALLQSDPCTNPDPVPLWVQIAAASPDRAQQFSAGGPDNGPYRSLTVEPGDNFYGARAQLGANDWRDSFWVYKEGDHTDTDFDIRLPANFPMNQNLWQQVMQMKQAQPSNDGGVVSPRIELDAYNGKWHFLGDFGNGSVDMWSAPATLGQWLHVHIDAMYSQDPNKGYISMTIGDQVMPTQHFATLVTEISGPETAIAPGQPIPACLMIGPYHASSYPAAEVDFANIQIHQGT